MELTALQQHDPREIGRQLQEGRKACGLTQEHAAKHLGVARTTITAIEKGERRVQPAELVSLAKLYKRSVSDFFRDSVVEESFTVQLRAPVAGQPASDHLASLVGDFQRLCEDYRELELICDVRVSVAYPAPYSIDGLDAEDAAEDVAVAERNRLGLGDGPILNLTEVLESDVGLRIFLMDLPSKLAGMFAFTESLKGCIAVNRNHPLERRRHSLVHEYGHFLTTRYVSEVTYLAKYHRQPRGERFADAFASAFLLPATGLKRRFHELKRQKDNITPTDLCILANYYNVSFEGLLVRLENLRLVPAGTWERLQQAGFRVGEAKALLGLPAYADDTEPLPPRYRYLATDAFFKEKLSEGQYARFLRRDRVAARGVADSLAVSSVLSDEGRYEQLTLPLGESLK